MESLTGTAFANVRFVERTGSTNDDIAAVLGTPGAAGLTIVADYQERGSGRKGRAWVAPPGASLLFTTALPHALRAKDLWIVPFWVALVVQRGLRESGVEATLQWPNDLLLSGRKIAGILCVSRVVGHDAWVGCGVGINVRRIADPLLEEIVPPPAFCSDVAPQAEREAVLANVLRAFDGMLELLWTPHNIARRWETAAGLPGVPYRILADGEAEPVDVEALRLSNDGGLVVRTAQNSERTINLADARVLRGL